MIRRSRCGSATSPEFWISFWRSSSLGYLLSKLSGNQSPHPPSFGPGTTTVELVGITGWPALLLLVLVIAYFVVLGRTGGTIFQRLFGMRRVK